MAESETYRKGSEMRRKLLGDAYVEKANQQNYNDPTTKKFIDVVTETVFGTLWTRPGLEPPRGRSLSWPFTCAWRSARAGPKTS